MRDFVNPALLVLVLALLVCRAAAWGGDAAAGVDAWTLGICATAVVVDFALALARACTHRAALGKAVWGLVFLLACCCVLAMPREDRGGDNPAVLEFQAMWASYRETGDAAATNEAGDTLLVLAAALGKKHVVTELLEKDPEPVMVARAMQRAAEAGRLEVVELLLPKVELNAVSEGTTPLISAASVGRHKVVEFLLGKGADPNLKDEEGMPPLSHAVLADSAPTVELLLKHGAAPSATDARGCKPADYSRNEKIDALFGR